MSICFFFFKQKTAYEMRISDWSSDVCSSDFDAGRRKRADGRFREHELIVKAALFLIACVASSGCDSGAAPASSETAPARSEERRVGKECVSTCRSRGSPDH